MGDDKVAQMFHNEEDEHDKRIRERIDELKGRVLKCSGSNLLKTKRIREFQ